MLKVFRENFKHLQWVLWVVIAIFVIFVFVDWGMGTAKGGGESDVAAHAGDIRITTGEFQREYKDTEDRYRQLYGKNFTPDLAKAMNLPEQVINSLIDRRLMKKEAERLHLSVSDDEVSSKVLSMKDSQGRPIFMKENAFVGEVLYKRMLANAGLTPETFEAQTREQILLEKLNRFFTESVFVSDQEVEDDFAARTVKAKIAYVLLPASPLPAGAVTDAEAEAAFKQNPTTYAQPEKRVAKYLLVETAKVRSSVKVADAEVAAEYSANMDSYRKSEEVHPRHILYKSDGSPAQDAAAKAKAEAALKKLKAGADFAALARAESEDTGSQASGGDLGSFGRGRMAKEFEDVAFTAEPKALNGPVKTPYGYHVIQVLERTGERVQPEFEVAPAIRARMQEKRATEEAKRLATELSAKIAKLGKPTDDQLRALAGPTVTFNETNAVSKTDAPAGIGFNPNFSQALFALKVGEVSEPVATVRGEALVKLVEIKKPGLPEFKDVKDRVVADLVKKKQDEATVAALKQAMQPGVTLEQIAAKLNLKIETPEAFSKNGPVPGLGGAKAILDAVFAGSVGEIKGPVAIADRGAAIVKVLEKTPFDKAKLDAERVKSVESIKNQKSGRLLQALIARRRSDLKVEINKELLARFGSRT
ncbi:MAG: SurA N-terminal domain-containing protein [Thermoanaerobaculia bacterium]